MDPRAQAAAILRQAREILLDRLSEAVVLGKSELLEDAIGASYAGEIATLFEQVGSRLHQVNTMLADLKLEPPPPRPSSEPGPGVEARRETAPRPLTALPAPPIVAGLLAARGCDEPATLESFARRIHEGDFAAAGRMLADLFGLEESRGRHCASTFVARVSESPDVIHRAMRLRYELLSGSPEGALELLAECFGLEPSESVRALASLRARVGR